MVGLVPFTHTDRILVNLLDRFLLVGWQFSQCHMNFYHNTTTICHSINLKHTKSTHIISSCLLNIQNTHNAHVEVIVFVGKVCKLSWRAIDVDETWSKGCEEFFILIGRYLRHTEECCPNDIIISHFVLVF